MMLAISPVPFNNNILKKITSNININIRNVDNDVVE